MQTPTKGKPAHLFLGNARPGTNNRRMMRRSAACFLIALGCTSALLHAESPAEAIKALVDAERKFAQTAQEKGTQTAFLEFLAEDGIVFRPGPVNGKEVWRARPDSGPDLIWEPTFAAIARSGDFGYDTGPAKWRAKKEGNFTGFGHFISVWKKQKDGSWKVALDCGIENTKSDVRPPLRLEVPKNAAKSAPQSLQDTQVAFLATAQFDFTKAFRQFGSDKVRLYRDGSFPTIGKADGVQLLGTEQAGVTMEVMKTEVSNSADLTYMYGSYSDKRTPPFNNGHFLQIWQTDSTGGWKLVLDWQQLAPKS
jgi:ketosteroid isomerase-like protein